MFFLSDSCKRTTLQARWQRADSASMAHQLNTDYLRRKLLNPQRQVSFFAQSPSLSPPVAAAPQMIRAAFHSLSLFLSLSLSLPAFSCFFGELVSSLSSLLQFTRLKEMICLLNPLCYILSRLSLVSSVSRLGELASADHLALRLFPAKASEPDENYSQRIPTHHRK